jgi:hypothetical protein
MCKKSFTLATFVRHSIPKVPENYYSLPAGIIEYQIAIGKGFPAYMPVINCSFRIKKNDGRHICIKIS